MGWMLNPAVLFTPSPREEEGNEDDHDGDEGSGDSFGEKHRDDAGSGSNEDAETNSSVEDHTNGRNDDDAETAAAANEEMMKDPDNGYFSSVNHIPFPSETLVATTFGEGKVIQYLQEEQLYEVSYPSSSTAYLKPDAVYSSLEPVEPSLLTEQLRSNDQEELERPDDQMIIGTQCLYLFFKLHRVLIRRLNIAKKLAVSVSKDAALGRHIEQLTHDGDPEEGAKRYESFLGLVYSLVDSGNGMSEEPEGGKYEDRVRSLLGNNAYELTTMDKLIAHVLKHLQNMANDDVLQNMIEIYRRHKLAGNFKPSAFHEEAALMSEGENMFTFQICDIPKTDQKIAHCEFLGCIAEDEEGEEDDEDGLLENDDEGHNKRGIDDVEIDDFDNSARSAKRPKRAV